MLKETGCDAVMIGRGAIGNPWLIKEIVEYLDDKTLPKEITLKERIDMIKHHIDLLKKNKSDKAALLEIRTFISGYLKGIRNSSTLRNNICQTKTLDELYLLLDNFYKENKDEC